jgi:branched-subunit amino acid aminotransferase/4-amino-4-deoxychorismate lyase
MSDDFSEGAAYVDGRYMPLGEATIPITDWGYRRCDVTYDVGSVWHGLFFRIEDHIARFRRSMNALRLSPTETDDDIHRILTAACNYPDCATPMSRLIVCADARLSASHTIPLAKALGQGLLAPELALTG